MTADPPELAGRTLEGTVARTVFSSDDSGWSVVQLDTDDGGSVTAVGHLLGLRDGDRLRLNGRWMVHSRFGEQFEVSTFVHVLPTTLAGLAAYLGSGRVRGIGPELARRLVATFGLDSLEVIEHDTDRLLEVRGIGPERQRRIRDSWAEQRGMQQVMVFLAGHGVSPALAARVHRRYGAAALEVVRSNPYQLAEDVAGIGFLTADRIARGLGMPVDAPERQEAALLHCLAQATLEGHVFLPRDRLLRAGAELLGSDIGDLGPTLERLARRDRVVTHPRSDGEPAVYVPRLEWAERTVAEDLAALLRARFEPIVAAPQREVARFEGSSGLELHPRQREALLACLERPAVVITGGPGTGKTTLVRGLAEIAARHGLDLQLAAPTGRAAKRLAEATSTGARTVHRLLEFNPALGVFNRGRELPLEADIVLVDEASMLDIELAARLLEAVRPGCRLVLVGDADQLPSVGPGNVLADLIASATAPVVRLQHIFRQGQRSLIVTNAHRVNRGEMPELGDPRGDQDFYMLTREDPHEAADTVIELATHRIPRHFRLDPVNDLQVLSPMHRGPLGVTELNRRLQEQLTPRGEELRVGARELRVGDKVMQLRNNYELDVFNGDIGRVLAIDTEERELVVSFDGRAVTIGAESLEDLTPAYACTIHKAQGSEYQAVVVVLHHSHHVMLQRNLLYTAITRARRLVVLVGSRRALHRAIANATVRARCTLLADRLAAVAAEED